MRVFVTGAAGFIGQAVIHDLLENGHQVLGLARNDAHAAIITKAGAQPHRGDLEDPESLKSGAKATDGVIHLAFVHDFNNFARATAIDRAAIAAMGEALAGTGKPLVIASGTMGLPKGDLVTEATEPERNNPLTDRVRSEDLVFALAKEKNVRGQVVRLTPTVHGAGDAGFIPILIRGARERGSVVYIGDGSARWPAVHRLDAAVLFRLALEKGAAGKTYHAVAEQGVRMRDIMALVGTHLRLPVEGKSMEEAAGAMGFFAYVVGADNPTSSARTREELGWAPVQLGLLDDMEANYFS